MPLERISAATLREKRIDLQARRRDERAYQLRWLIAFALRDLKGQTPTDADRLRHDLERFQAVHQRGVVLDPRSLQPGRRRRRSPTRLPALRVHEVRALQRQLGEIVRTLWPVVTAPITTAPPACWLPAQTSQLYLTRVGAGQVAAIAVAEWPATFWFAVASLLEEYGARLRRCPARRGSTVCGQLFLPTGRQRVCSTSCAQRERSRAWYAAHRAEAQERRRAAYLEEKLRPEPPTPSTRKRSPRSDGS